MIIRLSPARPPPPALPSFAWMGASAACIFLWVLMAAIEKSVPLAVFGVGATIAGILLTSLTPFRRPALTLFSVAVLIRAVVAAAAWLIRKDTEFATWTGDNDDSVRFFLNSFLPLESAVLTTEDRGFPAINTLITSAATWLGGAHYLCNVQVPLIAGALFPVAAYSVVKQHFGQEYAAPTGWLIALHPIAIGWSTGLMRDSLVSAASWMFIFYLLRAPVLRGFSRVACFWQAAVWAAVTFFLRSMNLYIAVLAYAGYVATGLFQSRSRRQQLWSIALAVLGLAFTAYMYNTPLGRERLEKSLRHGTHTRENVGQDAISVNQGGISEMIAKSGSPIVIVAASPYTLMAPFPFYSLFVPRGEQPTGIVEVCFGLGGLLNQLLLPAYAVGLLHAWKRRQWYLLYLCGPFVWIMCIMGMVAAFQTRWMMSATYIPLVISATVAFVQARQNGRLGLLLAQCIGFVALEYLAYWSIKGGLPLLVTAVLFGLPTAILAIWTVAATPLLSRATSSHRVEHFRSPRNARI